MKFGVFYEHQLPKPWDDGAELRLFNEALDQVELADRLGIDFAWEVEHHFLEEYSHSSAPEVFLAAASQRTRNIRLGHGIVLMPPRYNPPARIAERIATLDLVSNGRVEFGTGESASRTELEGFNIDPADKNEQWREAVEQVANMMVMDPYPGYDGKHWSMPSRNVVPKPVQKPHPPLWVACSNRETIHVAAKLGLGALTFTFVDAQEARLWVDDYYETFRNDCVPIGHSVNPNIALVMGFSVHKDEQVAIDRGLDGIRFFQFALGHYYGFGTHKPGRVDLWQQYLLVRDRLIGEEGKASDAVETRLAASRGAIGTPTQVRDYLRSLADIGVDQAVFIQQGGKNEHAHICDSLRVFAERVMPEFHAEEPERLAAKERALAPYIEQAFKRKRYMRPLNDDEIEEYHPYGRSVAEEAPPRRAGRA